MAQSERDQKTEQPTEKRLADARKRGEVALSPELRHGAGLAALWAGLGLLGASTGAALLALCASLWSKADQTADEALAWRLAGDLGWAIAPLLALTIGAALVAAIAQGPLIFARARLAPKWSKLSPIAGFKRQLGGQAWLEFGKALLRLTLVIMLAIRLLASDLAGLERLVGIDPAAIGPKTVTLALKLIFALMIATLAIALADRLWQQHSFTRRMMMTRQEVRDEMRQNDGDPIIKGRIRAIRLARARQRMMADVPKAAVIITNPTHYAVALSYDHGSGAPPRVVAKGTDAVALRIREVAKEAGVAIVEAPPLARALHATLEIGQPIQIEHYQAVAEIIGQVLRIAAGAGSQRL